MTWIWPSLGLIVAAIGPSALAAQQVREVGGLVLLTTANPALVTGGLYAALRPSARARIAATLSGGVSDGRSAGRGELVAHFLLSPTATERPGVYFGGGVAGVVGPVDQGYVVLLAGIEAAPGGRSGWALEAGIGGGLRFTAGWRWRWRHQRSLK